MKSMRGASFAEFLLVNVFYFSNLCSILCFLRFLRRICAVHQNFNGNKRQAVTINHMQQIENVMFDVCNLSLLLLSWQLQFFGIFYSVFLFIGVYFIYSFFFERVTKTRIDIFRRRFYYVGFRANVLR